MIAKTPSNNSNYSFSRRRSNTATIKQTPKKRVKQWAKKRAR